MDQKTIYIGDSRIKHYNIKHKDGTFKVKISNITRLFCIV